MEYGHETKNSLLLEKNGLRRNEMTRQQELEHWTKCERYFAKATPEQIMNCAKWYLILDGHYTPCRCADEQHRLLEGIEHTEMFGILRNKETIKLNQDEND